MVERLRTAIQKARALRERLEPDGGTGGLRSTRRHASTDDQLTAIWDALAPVDLNDGHLERHRVISHAKDQPAHIAFDVLRTKILRVLKERGWSRVGITSATKSSGKTFVSANLAFSMSRQQNYRTVLMDMDLRLPNLANTLGLGDVEKAQWFLTGEISPDAYFRRYGTNLAIGANDERVTDSAELILDPCVAQALNGMRGHLQPDVVIYDLPPVLACDDVIGFLPQLDCVLLVVGGGTTRADEVAECERMLSDQTNLLGVVLNKAEDPDPSKYGYGYY